MKYCILIISLAVFAVGSVSAAPQVKNVPLCKGKLQSVCQSNKACSWVKAFTRKDGIEVKPYCRKKSAAKKKSTTKTAKANTQQLKKNTQKTRRTTGKRKVSSHAKSK